MKRTEEEKAKLKAEKWTAKEEVRRAKLEQKYGWDVLNDVVKIQPDLEPRYYRYLESKAAAHHSSVVATIYFVVGLLFLLSYILLGAELALSALWIAIGFVFIESYERHCDHCEFYLHTILQYCRKDTIEKAMGIKK